MEEIAKQFREELQYLLDRYKNRLTVPRIMHVAQDVFHKTLSIRYHPELHTAAINFLQSTGYTKLNLDGEFKSLDDVKVTSNIKKICEKIDHNHNGDVNA